jgi:hypothetical protein
MVETGVHDARNDRSRSPEWPFTIERNGCSRWSGMSVHDRAERALDRAVPRPPGYAAAGDDQGLVAEKSSPGGDFIIKDLRRVADESIRGA